MNDLNINLQVFVRFLQFEKLDAFFLLHLAAFFSSSLQDFKY